jgi:hypothetical protein
VTDPELRRELRWQEFYDRLRRALREDPETAAFVVATIGEHRPESATPVDLARRARAFASRRSQDGGAGGEMNR